jgi:hypothetical protein
MHIRSTRFSLVGRPIRLTIPYRGYTEGRIVEQTGPANFGLELWNADGIYHSIGIPRPIVVGFHRSEFTLPPLPRVERDVKWENRLPDDYDGFVYGSEFVNPYARLQ